MASSQDASSAIDPSPSSGQENQTLSLWALTALVVGSMVGAGIFTLPGRFARATGVVGALIAWAIAGAGMLMLAFVFQNLAQRKPELDSGPFIYAKAGFGNYIGFLAALAFWSATCVGNVSYFVLIKSTLGEFFPDLWGWRYRRRHHWVVDHHLAVSLHDFAGSAAGGGRQHHRHDCQNCADSHLRLYSVVRL
jgi:amino acid transporter